ncbi:hypothetical protein GZ59_19460 [Pectobacterium atrosepticum]|nr:hypothetical protein GZ59_19460 [Pectobacterium atrosepticum]POW31974.1 phage tail protein [Pectobacterium atrosepticum]
MHRTAGDNMTWPTITINQLNQLQGETKEIERVVLFVGRAVGDAIPVTPVNTQSNLDSLLGAEDSTLKRCVEAARLNAGQNWSAFVVSISDDELDEQPAAEVAKIWAQRVENAQAVASVEGVVVTLEATKSTIAAAASLRTTLISKYGRWVWFILSVSGLQAGESWTVYLARLADLQRGDAVPSVQLVPNLWGSEAGVLAGRLCSRAVTVADSPARVRTGPLIGMGTVLPVDSDDMPLGLATLQALEAIRYSVPMWYPDYDGIYWADGRTLDVEGGDYQVIEHLRIVDKIARRVRLQAIAKIADRSMNSTPGSIAAHQTFFARHMREMSRSSQINNVTFPGEVQSPREGDVVIAWTSSVAVAVYLTVRPYGSPKSITVGIMLDATLEA